MSYPAIDDILSKLKKVRPNGSGWMACCPAHEDTNPSLSISRGDNGKPLLYCFAGCKYEDIAKILGLQADGIRAADSYKGLPIVCRYDYKDEDDRLLYQIERTTTKEFPVRVPTGNGWKYGLNGTRRVLYRLPELIKADPQNWVFLVEGEKDCDRLASLGLTTTTNMGGAADGKDKKNEKWRPEYNEFFRGRRVCILPDNDEPGKKHAKRVQEEIGGIVKDVRIVELPELPKSGDVSDWLNNGGDSEKLLLLVNQAESCKSHIKIKSLAAVTAKPIQWFWPNRIPQGMLSLLVGNPGIGKSFLSMYMTAQITTGRDWPDSKNEIPSGSVILFADEESLEYAIKPRLEAHGTDCSKVYSFDYIALTKDKQDMFSLSDHMDLLANLIDSVGDVRLIIFDPITAYLRGVDANNNAEVRSAMIGVQNLAQRKNFTILGVSHFSKKTDLDAIHRTLGSTGFVAAARSVWAVVNEKIDENSNAQPRRLFLSVKSNYSVDPQGLAFDIIDGRVKWFSETITATVDQSLATNTGRKKSKSIKDACDWLRAQLENAPCSVDELKQSAKRAGFNYYQLTEASKQLPVTKQKSGYNGGWVWTLNVEDEEEC